MLLRCELEELQRGCFVVGEVVKDSDTGSCKISLTMKLPDEDLNLLVSFPITYPENAPEVIATDLELAHHLNPNDKNLCPLFRPFTNWNRSWSLAEFLSAQIPLTLRAGRSQNIQEASTVEANQAEPISIFLNYEPNSVVLVDGDSEFNPTATHGIFEGEYSATEAILKVTIRKVRADGTDLIQNLPKHPWSPSQLVKGSWYTVDSLPIQQSAQQYIGALSQQHTSIKFPRWFEVSAKTEMALFGFWVPEETGYRQMGRSWLFVAQKRPIARPGQVSASFVRTLRADRKSISKRLPNMGDKTTHHPSLFGVGCIGALLGIELAKLGLGSLTLVDPDFVDPGPTVRWPLGLQFSGDPKVLALKAFIDTNFPWTQINMSDLRFGSALGNVSLEQYTQILDHATMVIDATAEVTISWALAQIAREKAVPFVSLSSTPGGESGQIVVINPGDAACAECIAWHQQDKTIPSFPRSELEDVQPAGCSDPTFIAAGFDTSQVPLAAARLIASLISESAKAKIAGNYFYLRMRDDQGNAILPVWESYKVGRHSNCKRHSDEVLV